MYRVYIIENASGVRYIGLSEDAAERLRQHNRGESRWTKNRGPWNLTWMSNSLSLSKARLLELAMKRQKGGVGLIRLMDKYRGS